MSPDMQVKLLRVLETNTLKRVGGEKAIRVDVRLVAATNRPPEKAVEDGKLREDLYYRLRVFPIIVPPLRDRPGDVDLLAEYFLEELNGDASPGKRFGADALEELRCHSWPGNVRELRNVVERAFILAGDVVSEEDVRVTTTDPARHSGSVGSDVSIDVGTSIAEAEKKLILETLDRFDGDKKRAAQILGISLKTLYNRLNSYGMGRSGPNAKAGRLR